MVYQMRLKTSMGRKRFISRKNGKKGGRPKLDSEIRIQLPEIELVILTPDQYSCLLEKYGYDLLRKSLVIFDNWLQFGGKSAEKYVGKNNYAHFRADGWVINEAQRSFCAKQI